MIGSMDPVCSIDLAKHLWNVTSMGVSPCNVRAREQTGFFVTRIIQDGAFLPHRHERIFLTMKRKLSAKEYTYVASMLFGLFFGAGNLIFPVHLGQMAGSNVWQAILGLLITGVGLPLLGVAALGISRSNGLFDLSSKVNRPYAMFFTCALYLTIGPFFAIPRCATTSFTVGLEQVLPQNGSNTLYLLLFSVAFFAAALFFALRPGKILTWVGKILNPCFLVFLGILVVVALLSPSAAIADVEPLGDYASQPFFAGFLEGYNTMDALASLAFGIIVVQVIRDLGVDDPTAVAGSTGRGRSRIEYGQGWRVQQPSDGVHLYRRHDRRHAEPRRA